MDSPLKEPIKVIADIIQSEMDLDAGQVMVYNQKYNIPKTDKLFIVISNLGDKIIGNNNYTVPTVGGMNEIQETVSASLIQIDLMSPESKDVDGNPYNEARNRRIELIMALKSIYAQKKCDENEIRVSFIPSSFVDISIAEGTSMLTRYAITITTYSISRKIKVLEEYFDTFKTPEVHVDDNT